MMHVLVYLINKTQCIYIYLTPNLDKSLWKYKIEPKIKSIRSGPLTSNAFVMQNII